MMAEELSETKPLLEHVLWVAGGTCSGKSSITRRLAEEWDAIRYDGSERFRTDHLKRADSSQYPTIDLIRRNTTGNRPGWAMRLTPCEFLRLLRDLSREALEMAVADLLAMPGRQRIVVDSFRLSFAVSEIIALSDPSRAIFLGATSDFLRSTWAQRFEDRNERERLSGHFDDPDVIMANFLDGQCLATEWLRDECRRLKLPFLLTGGRRSLDESYAYVCKHFGLCGGGT